MPETAMNKHYRLMFRHHHVWLAGEFGFMQAEPEPHPVQNRTHNFLRPGILAFDPAHVPAPPRFGEGIGHAGQTFAGLNLALVA